MLRLQLDISIMGILEHNHCSPLSSNWTRVPLLYRLAQSGLFITDDQVKVFVKLTDLMSI